MATVNFPNSPSNGQTLTTNTGITYTYNSSKARWDATTGYVTASALDNYLEVANSSGYVTASALDNYLEVANSSSVGVTTYSALSDLPLSGQSTGKMAYVSGTNRLYLWAGSGWYNIALVNTDPSISGASSTYNLDAGGANTVVTLASSDPEGLPISFSLSTSGLGVGANAIATVTQSNNIFTFTPTTNTALEGTFTATFTASDGVNVAVANSSFTLAFTVNNSNYTTALITSVGTNNQVNNTFVDSSTNSHTITAAGNATQTTFSPYRHGGNAVSFAGTNSSSENYLWINAAIVPATGSWTYESWVRVDRKSDGERHSLISWYTNSVSGRGNVFVRADNESNPGIVFVYVDGMSAYPQSTTRVDDGAWHHVVVERDGNVWSVWIDGTRENQETQNVTLNTSVNTRLGHIINTAATSHSGFKGSMRDVRFSASARYSGAASLDVPDEDQATTTGYALLCCQSFDPFTDRTGNREITVYSSTSVKQVGSGPYDYETYSASDHGGSAQFDGTGDYLATAADSSLTVGTGQFTLECWFQVNTDAQYTLLALINGGTNVMNIFYYHTNDSIGIYDSGWVTGNTGSGTNHDIIDLNIWYHLALVRDTTNMKLYVNGVERHSAANSTNYNNDRIWIGQNQYGNNLAGNISDVRLVKGTAVYTSNFTPPTAPLTAITNTSLLLNGTNAGIIDKAQSIKDLALTGNTKSSTTQTKYLTSSMYFDGSGDAIKLPANYLDLGASDFTLEAWAYTTATSQQAIAGSLVYSNGTGAWLFSINYNGNKIRFFTRYGGGTIQDAQFEAGTFPTNQWVHVAVTRNGANLRAFINGTQAGSTNTGLSSSAIDDATTNYYIGDNLDGNMYWSGYISDVRITKGLARYTSNFTPPTSALLG